MDWAASSSAVTKRREIADRGLALDDAPADEDQDGSHGHAAGDLQQRIQPGPLIGCLHLQASDLVEGRRGREP